MQIKKIYFDMDGVLADFNRGIIELCGMQPVDQSNNKSDNDIWDGVRRVEYFYDKLEPVEGAVEMFNTLYEKYGDACEILSAIPKPGRGIIGAGEDKIKWVRRILSDEVKVNIVYREEKKNYCTGRDCILIDDYDKNITDWNNAGGTGILFDKPENVSLLASKLEKLEKLEKP